MANEKIKVNVFDNNGTTPLLSDFYIYNISPHRRARMIGHPVEDGTTVFDNKVVEPDRVSIVGEVYTSDDETMTKINEMLDSKEFKFYTISSLALDYTNMSLIGRQERQSAEHPDASEITLEFQEVLKVAASEQIPRDPANASTAS